MFVRPTISTFASHEVVIGVSSRVLSLYDQSKEGLLGRLLYMPVGKGNNLLSCTPNVMGHSLDMEYFWNEAGNDL